MVRVGFIDEVDIKAKTLGEGVSNMNVWEEQGRESSANYLVQGGSVPKQYEDQQGSGCDQTEEVKGRVVGEKVRSNGMRLCMALYTTMDFSILGLEERTIAPW